MSHWKDKAWLIPYVCIGIGLSIGYVYDYQINAYLYDPNNLFGLFFERIILVPIEMIIPVCFFAMYRIYKELRYFFCYVIACGYVVIDMAHYWTSISQVIWLLLFIMIALVLVITLLLHKVPVTIWRSHERFLWFLLSVFLSALIVTFTLKQCWGRVRYREMLQDTSQFTRWIVPQGFSGHHSFPSGHTTVMSVILCFLYYYKHKEPLREVSMIVKGSIVVLILAMMVSRMIMGAHFLSDVTAGFCVTYTMVQLWKRRFFRGGYDHEYKKNRI